MDLKPISLKVPVDVLARLDAAAKDAGLSRTAILLKPWDGSIAVLVPVTEGAPHDAAPGAINKVVNPILPSQVKRILSLGFKPVPASGTVKSDGKPPEGTRLKGLWKPTGGKS